MFAFFPVNRHQATFRVNSQVVLMFGVVLVALAVPLTSVILGVRKFSAPRQASSAPDTTGLRIALEQAAEKSWHPPEMIADGRSVFTLSSLAKALETRKSVEQSAQKLGGIVLSATADTGGGVRLLVQVPSARTQVFETETLRNFVPSQHGDPAGGSRLYELIFPEQ